MTLQQSGAINFWSNNQLHRTDKFSYIVLEVRY